MPDRMPNRMSEDMSDRMPEDVPVRTCINVMVGITRSKVIFWSHHVPWYRRCTEGLQGDPSAQSAARKHGPGPRRSCQNPLDIMRYITSLI